MNAWLIAATALLTGLVPLGAVVVASGSAVDRLVALELAGDVDAVILRRPGPGAGPAFVRR